MRIVFFLFTIPALLCGFVLPVTAFMYMSWWKPIPGVFAAALLVNLVTRRILSERSLFYAWAIGFALTGLSFFAAILGTVP